MVDATLEKVIDDTAQLFHAPPPLDEALKALETQSAKLMYPDEMAYVWTKCDHQDPILQHGGIVNVGLLMVPKATYRRIFVKDPVRRLGMREIEKAVCAYRNREQYEPPEDFVKEIQEFTNDKYPDPGDYQVKDQTLFPLKKELRPIITKMFRKSPFASWAFQNKAGMAGDYLDGRGVPQIQVPLYSNSYIDLNQRNGRPLFHFMHMGGVQDGFRIAFIDTLPEQPCYGISGVFNERMGLRNYLREGHYPTVHIDHEGGQEYVAIEHKNTDDQKGHPVTFLHERIGPGTFAEIHARLKELKLRWPTLAELVTLVHDTWPIASCADIRASMTDSAESINRGEIDRSLKYNRGLCGNTGILYSRTQNAAFVQDGIHIAQPIKMIGDEVTVKATNGDKWVRRVPFGTYDVGRLFPHELVRDAFVKALVGSNTGALNIAEIADMYNSKPSFTNPSNCESNRVCIPTLVSTNGGFSLCCDNFNVDRRICTYGVRSKS